MIMNITHDLPFLNIHNSFTNKRISVYWGKQSPMSLDAKDYFVKQTSHLSKRRVLVASAQCQFLFFYKKWIDYLTNYFDS